MRTLSSLLLVLIAAAGCASDDEEARLAGACQMQRCACGPEGWSPFMAGGNVPVQWRKTGEAYCPEGYRLYRIAPKPGRTGPAL